MSEERRNPQINVSKIVSGGGIAGAIFAVTSILILLFGIPALWIFLPAAILVGFAVAFVLRFARHETPGKPWILSTAEPHPERNRPNPARAENDRKTFLETLARA